MYTLYGIKNCDTIKKTRSWLNEHHVIYRFHDYQVDGLTPGARQNFIACLGWTPLLNTRGTTWRRLSETERAEIRDAASAHSLMLQKPAIIKRPILESSNGVLLLGFNIEQYRHFLKHS